MIDFIGANAFTNNFSLCVRQAVKMAKIGQE